MGRGPTASGLVGRALAPGVRIGSAAVTRAGITRALGMLTVGVLLVVGAWAIAPAAPAGAERTPVSPGLRLRDDRDHWVLLPRPPLRIVTLLPSLTETVCALGACARLVGTDRYSNWPAAAAALPKLGGLEDASLEGIVALHPDVVLAARSSRVIERLEELGVPVIALDTATFAQVRHVLAVVAQLLGEPAAGEAAWRDLQARIAAAAAQLPAAARGREVYFEVSEAPYAAGAGSFIGELLARLGLGNVVPAALGPFPKLNPEFVVRAQPAIIIASATALDGMRRRPGWETLEALRLGWTCGFPAAQFDVLIRPGPRLGEAAELIVACLQKRGGKVSP